MTDPGITPDLAERLVQVVRDKTWSDAAIASGEPEEIAVAFLRELVRYADTYTSHTPDGDYISFARVRSLADEIERTSR